MRPNSDAPFEIHLKRDESGSFGIFFSQKSGAIRGVSRREPRAGDGRSCLKEGDFVIRVGGMPVKSVRETIELMRRAGSFVYITVRRGADASGEPASLVPAQHHGLGAAEARRARPAAF